MNDDAFNMMWPKTDGCGGCAITVIDHGAAGWFRELETASVNLLWHPSVSQAPRKGSRYSDAFRKRQNIASCAWRRRRNPVRTNRQRIVQSSFRNEAHHARLDARACDKIGLLRRRGTLRRIWRNPCRRSRFH